MADDHDLGGRAARDLVDDARERLLRVGRELVAVLEEVQEMKDVGRPGCASSAAPNACRASCSVTAPASTRPGSFTRAAA